MADTFHHIPKGSGKPFALHKAGQFAAQCSDILDMGEKWEQFQNEPGRLVRKVRFIFRTGEINPDTEKPFEVSKEFTLSSHSKSSLRPFLETWLGKPFKDDAQAHGALVNLDKLEGRWAFISIVHKSNADGSRTYANLNAIMPLPEQMPKPTLPPYTRDPFWAKKKSEYAAEVRERAPVPTVDPTPAPSGGDPFADFEAAPAGLDDDGDLPF